MEDNFKLNIHLSKTYVFDVNVVHQSIQVVRFHLKCGSQELNVEKRLLSKGQPWKVTSANFNVTNPDATKNINTIFQYLDETMKEPRVAYIHPKNY